jgi:hypothetical protein
MPRPVDHKSIRSVAARLGRSATSLHRAIRSGSVDADDLERSAAAWNAACPKAERPVPGSAEAKARARVDKARADLLELRVQKERGRLVDREKTLATLFEAAKMTREAIEQWPAQEAAPIAARLGLDDPHLVENVLAESLHDLLVRTVEQMKREL